MLARLLLSCCAGSLALGALQQCCHAAVQLRLGCIIISCCCWCFDLPIQAYIVLLAAYAARGQLFTYVASLPRVFAPCWKHVSSVCCGCAEYVIVGLACLKIGLLEDRPA